MTTTPNEPSAPEPSQPAAAGSTDQPAWGTPPLSPLSGSGTDRPGTFGATTPGASAPGNSTPGARFFDAVRGFGIVRPDQGRRVAGVAAGIARRYKVDPVVVRITLVILTLFGGLGVGLYGLGWLFLPHPDGRIHAQQVLTGTVTAGFFGALLAVLVGVPHALPLMLAALVVGIIVHHRRTNHCRPA